MNFDEQLNDIKELGENWDSYGACPPLEGVVDNAVKLHSLIDLKYCRLRERVSLSPTPYGTVVMEYSSSDGQRDVVSIEVGQHSVGWFVEGLNKETHHGNMSEGVETDFSAIPSSLEGVLLAMERGCVL
ncbi:MAG: hypothetical protein LUD72_02595 [Bacteroidales bacterium]|nr:hypothetical protein [Bacteroidales bacterium]